GEQRRHHSFFTMTLFDAELRWIDDQHARMCGLVPAWAAINSGGHNLEGLGRMSSELRREFAVLGGDVAEVPLPSYTSIDNAGATVQTPLAPALLIRKRSGAPRRVFLNIHMDTVYGLQHPFQGVERIDAKT